jgi:hypothetical protein
MSTGSRERVHVFDGVSQEGLVGWHLKLLVTKTPLKMQEAMRKRTDGRVVNATTTIMDMDGFSMGMLLGATKEYLAQITKIDSDNFPETMGSTIIINAPTIFSVAWGIIKGFIDPRTQAKVKVYGSNYLEHLAEILGGLDKVPAQYGGTLHVPHLFEVKAKTFAVHAGKKHAIAVKCAAGRGVRFRWISDPADVVFGVVAVTGSPAELERALADPGAFDASKGRVVYAPVDHPDSKTKTVQCLVNAEDVKTDTVFIATWDNSAGWSQRHVRYFAHTLPNHEERGKQYQAELLDHGIEGDDAITALRERGFTELADEMAGGASAAASASSASA